MGMHNIQGGFCMVCGMPASTARWKTMAYAGCPGVTWLRVDELAAQTHLATETQLRQMHQKPGPEQQPVACYWSGTAQTYRMLYDMREAVPVRMQTERQKAACRDALRAARAALTCTWCRVRVRSKSALRPMTDGHRLCVDCARRWQIGIEAQAILRTPERFCVLDTETTGVDPWDEIVEIAVLGVERRRRVDGMEGGMEGAVLLNTLVQPIARSIPPQVTAIHGITDQDVATAPSFAEILPQLAAAVAGRTVLIYNAAFDGEMIRAACARLGDDVRSPVRRNKSVCMMEWYAEWCGILRRAGDYEWIPLNGGHRALGDCRAVLARLQKMAEIPSPLTAPSAVVPSVMTQADTTHRTAAT